MKTLVHHYPYRVRYADTDTMHYMYNGQYLTLFEIGRTELLRSVGLPYAEMEKSGFLLPVMEATVRYLMPAFYDEELDIETTYRWEGSASVTMHYRILRGHDVVAVGSTKHCFVDAAKRTPVRPPAFFVEHVT
ncbi:MAG: acyl-CoA thioesterase [Candidatus Kapaibacterium sp.]